MALPRYLQRHMPSTTARRSTTAIPAVRLGIGSVAPGTAAPVGVPRPVTSRVVGGSSAAQRQTFDFMQRAQQQARDAAAARDRAAEAARNAAADAARQRATGVVPQQGGGPAKPALSGPRVFFDPLSSTLWRTEDGREFALPGDTSTVNFMDGNLLNSSMAKEASFFYNQGQGAYKMNTALRGFDRELDKLGEKDALGRTLFDVLSGQAKNQWTQKADGAMASAAERGIYDSGMRNTTAVDLATELSNANRDLDTSYGKTAIANLGKQKNDAREQWVADWLSQFTNYYNTKVAGDVENELNGVATGGAAPAGPAPTAPVTPAPVAPVAPKPAAPVSNRVGSGIGSVPAGTAPPVAAPRMTLAQARDRFTGARTFKAADGSLRYTSAWSNFLKANGLA